MKYSNLHSTTCLDFNQSISCIAWVSSLCVGNSTTMLMFKKHLTAERHILLWNYPETLEISLKPPWIQFMFRIFMKMFSNCLNNCGIGKKSKNIKRNEEEEEEENHKNYQRLKKVFSSSYSSFCD